MLFADSLTALSLLSAVAVASSCSPENYYATFDVSSFFADSYSLQSAIQTLTQNGHTPVSYSNTWAPIKDLDEDPNNPNNVLLVYKRTSVLKSDSGWNREHTWPDSRGLSGSGPDYPDLHNLRAADGNINSKRGNLPYGECTINVDAGCTAPVTISSSGEQAAADTSSSSSTFMPPAEIRGDISRSLFYMASRYDGVQDFTSDLVLANCDGNSCSGSVMGDLSPLLKWHVEDPIDEIEKIRNSKVCGYQKNRNPFVDVVGLVEAVFLNEFAVDTGVFLSGYAESGNNKALRLTNADFADSANLDQYDLVKVQNGGGSFSDLGGGVLNIPKSTLGPKESLVLCYSQTADAALLEICDDASSGWLNFNGNDAIALRHNGVVVDAIGTEESSPPAAWTVCGTALATQDSVLIRKFANRNGNSFAAASCEWKVLSDGSWSALSAPFFASAPPSAAPTVVDADPADELPTTAIAASAAAACVCAAAAFLCLRSSKVSASKLKRRETT